MKKIEESYYCDSCGDYISDLSDRYEYIKAVVSKEKVTESHSDLCASCVKRITEDVKDERLIKAMVGLSDLYNGCEKKNAYPEIKELLEKYYGESIEKIMEIYG